YTVAVNVPCDLLPGRKLTKPYVYCRVLVDADDRRNRYARVVAYPKAKESRKRYGPMTWEDKSVPEGRGGGKKGEKGTFGHRRRMDGAWWRTRSDGPRADAAGVGRTAGPAARSRRGAVPRGPAWRPAQRVRQPRRRAARRGLGGRVADGPGA